jgi:protein-L-isoaspartate(D-aspartate) O-methyltransferase
MHAAAVEHVLTYLRPDASAGSAPSSPRRVLDVGSGSGYLTHVLAELIGDGPDGVVVGVENIAALRDLGESNMRKSERGRALLDEGRVRFRLGDGRKGWREEAEGGGIGGSGGWDVIHVGASAKELHPELVDQLKAPGR